MIKIDICPICENDNKRLAYDFKIFKYHRCSSCDFLWQSPVMEENDLKSLYSKSYFNYEHANQNNFFNLMKKGLDDIKFLDYADKNLKNKSFLDIGCAIGKLVKYFHDFGWKSKGIDVCKESIEYGKEKFNIDLISEDLYNANFKNEEFDTIHTSHVFEHVLNPKQWLKEINRILKNSGVLILTTPNTHSFQRHFYKKNWRNFSRNHVQLFGKKNLKMIIEQSGFEILDYVTWGGIPAGKAPNWIKNIMDRLAKKFGFGDVQLIFCKKIQSI